MVTKSGANAFHGDAFEFLRNTDLDARNYFSPTRGTFDQNQFGGTFGGPIRKNKVFFFADYQGTRSTQGVDTGEIPVPSAQDRTGNLIDMASAFVTKDVNGNTVPTTVSGSYWAGLLSSKLRLHGLAGRTLLHSRLRQHRSFAVRLSERRHSAGGLVGPGNQPSEIHSGSQQFRRHLFHFVF